MKKIAYYYSIFNAELLLFIYNIKQTNKKHYIKWKKINIKYNMWEYSICCSDTDIEVFKREYN